MYKTGIFKKKLLCTMNKINIIMYIVDNNHYCTSFKIIIFCTFLNKHKNIVYKL